MKVAKHALAAGGLLLAIYGAALIYRPAGWIAGGLVSFAIALLIDRSERSKE